MTPVRISRGAVVLDALSWLLCSAARAVTTTTFLTNPGVYAAIGSSEFSDFGNFTVGQMFDDNRDSEWAIDGFVGKNPQGRDEGWVSITLDQTYLISQFRFAPRRPTGGTDGIDLARLWLSTTPFNVNVRSAASTSAFRSSSRGQSPELTLGPFATLNEVDYALGSVVAAKYIVGQFVNTSDHDFNRNLSVNTLEAGVVGVVPEPGSLVLVAGNLAILATGVRRRASGRRLLHFPNKGGSHDLSRAGWHDDRCCAGWAGGRSGDAG